MMKRRRLLTKSREANVIGARVYDEMQIGIDNQFALLLFAKRFDVDFMMFM